MKIPRQGTRGGGLTRRRTTFRRTALAVAVASRLAAIWGDEHAGWPAVRIEIASEKLRPSEFDGTAISARASSSRS